jgi:ATP-dependent helicase/nuclease subunit B
VDAEGSGCERLIFQRRQAYNRDMDRAELVPGEIVNALERGAIVVTGNQRAARTLRRGFDQRNRQLGLKSWTPAAVLSWDAWIAALWRELLLEGRATELLLNRTQEHQIWRTILNGDDELASLKTADSLAEMAADTWRLLSSYGGRERLRVVAGGTDTRAFQRWARAFERLCKAKGLSSVAQLEETLREAVNRGWISPPAGGVVLVGFDALTPAQTGLLEALRSAGVEVEELTPRVDAVRRMLTQSSNEREEMEAAAQWVRHFLESKPEARIAIVVPGLEAQRSEIDRVFREVLAPESEDIRVGNEAVPYEFSLGVRLSETTMAATALDLLRWAVEPLPLERVSGLLLSPYLARAADERSARAAFDAFELRKTRMLRPEISLENLAALMERSKRRSDMPLLTVVLRKLRYSANRVQGMNARSNAEWTHEMRELLEAAAWGAGSTETSLEFQMRQKWEGALDELATLDFDGATAEFEQALTALERIARQTMFAPASREAPVQVMGPLEAAGGTFDALWFLRAGELSWPMPTASSSLLPWALQRNLGMPGTDVARDTDHARGMTERVASCAGAVVFSYARESAEGHQRPSPLLAGLALEEVASAEFVASPAERGVVALEEIDDVEPVRAPPDEVMRGGARILQLQAACEFRAFAEQRLWSTELEPVTPGMDARESGVVVHDALRRFWDEVRTQDALRQMTPEEREKTLRWSIDKALERAEDTSATTWDEAYLKVQRERLLKLLGSWLELEMARRMPFEVRQSEKEFKDVRVGPLRLSVRMDRIDEVDGGDVLIDYKTGAAEVSEWLTDRPDAPQLPLYAIVSQAENLQGVAFALVRAGEGRGMKGYEAQPGVLPTHTKLKEAETLEEQVVRWRQVLTALAEEFYRGDARVQPKNYPSTCARCNQRVLCRLDASLLEEEDELDISAEGDRG